MGLGRTREHALCRRRVHEAGRDCASHARVMHACMKRNRGRIRCIFARYEEYAACMCVHGGGAYMPASNRVAFLRAQSENVKRGFAGRSLRIWLKILRRNAWLILYHRTKSPNSREVPSDAAGRPPWRGHVRFKQDQRFRTKLVVRSGVFDFNVRALCYP